MSTPNKQTTPKKKLKRRRPKQRKKDVNSSNKPCDCRWSNWLDNNDATSKLDDNRYVNLPKKYKLNSVVIDVSQIGQGLSGLSSRGMTIKDDLAAAAIREKRSLSPLSPLPYSAYSSLSYGSYHNLSKRSLKSSKKYSTYDSAIPCHKPVEIECRKKLTPGSNMSRSEQYTIPDFVACNKDIGLICNATTVEEVCVRDLRGSFFTRARSKF